MKCHNPISRKGLWLSIVFIWLIPFNFCHYFLLNLIIANLHKFSIACKSIPSNDSRFIHKVSQFSFTFKWLIRCLIPVTFYCLRIFSKLHQLSLVFKRLIICEVFQLAIVFKQFILCKMLQPSIVFININIKS